MDFEEIRGAVKEINSDALRADDAVYFEAVLLIDDTPKLTLALEHFFGKAVFPAKNSLSFTISRDIDGFGGIMPGQTLYYRSKGGEIIFAMLWPWKDDRHVTVKIIKR